MCVTRGVNWGGAFLGEYEVAVIGKVFCERELQDDGVLFNISL